MAYAYWKAGKHDDAASFDVFFRKNPFGGEYTIFAGLSEVLTFLEEYKFTAEQQAFLRTLIPQAEPEFFDYLFSLDCSQVKIRSIREGSVVFPRVPLMIVSGPLGIVQLLETTILNLVNYPSLMATNASRFRRAAGSGKGLLEFGLRRAQGPNGGMSASLYAHLGGFDATSNVCAGLTYGIPVRGTQAHSFVTSFSSLSDVAGKSMVKRAEGQGSVDLHQEAVTARDMLQLSSASNEGELASFIAYAVAYPHAFLTLVDTYDTLSSGLPNFIYVAVALEKAGFKAAGIRLDSGDLAYLSLECRRVLKEAALKTGIAHLEHSTIVASNDINEEVLSSLNEHGHSIDTFGIGTHLVTCQKQPALGCVYKLVALNHKPRIKLSQESEKVTIPGEKKCFRLYSNTSEHPLVDLLTRVDETVEVGQRIMLNHVFDSAKRAFIVPDRVEELHSLVFDGKSLLNITPSYLKEARAYCIEQISRIRPDHARRLNPTPFKVSISTALHQQMKVLWEEEAPIVELK